MRGPSTFSEDYLMRHSDGTVGTIGAPRTPQARKVWTLVLASLGVFMTALDTLVGTTALPMIRGSLHGSLSDLDWTGNASNLAFACPLLTGAALGCRFVPGRR